MPKPKKHISSTAKKKTINCKKIIPIFFMRQAQKNVFLTEKRYQKNPVSLITINSFTTAYHDYGLSLYPVLKIIVINTLHAHNTARIIPKLKI